MRHLRQLLCGVVVFWAGLASSAASGQMGLGPEDPGAEQGGNWYLGTNGTAYLFVDKSDPNTGNNDLTLGNKVAGKENQANWRSLMFPLGPAANGAQPMTFSFSYKLPDKVAEKDNIMVFIRFFDEKTNFLGQHSVLLGSRSRDSEMTGYRTVTMKDIRAVKNATGIRIPKTSRTTIADIWITANIFQPWSSGDARFDDFSVTTVQPPPWVVRHWTVSLLAVLIPLAVLFTILGIRESRKG